MMLMANLSDTVVSIIRTVVPAAWGSLMAWLITMIPALHIIEDQSFALGQIVSLVVIGLWYSVSRTLEPRMPEWLRNILFGVSSTPEYDSIDVESL